MCRVDCVKAQRKMVTNKKFDSKNRSQTYSFSNSITFAATVHTPAQKYYTTMKQHFTQKQAKKSAFTSGEIYRINTKETLNKLRNT